MMWTFFDKLLRDHMITSLKKERKEQEDFIDTIETVRDQINHILPISKVESGILKDQLLMRQTIVLKAVESD